MPGGRPVKFSDPESLQKQIDAYFAKCEEEKDPPRITGLAIFLGVHTDTLLEYQKNRKEFSAIIKCAKQKIEDHFVKEVMQRDKPTGHIFLLKANFGYRDNLDLRHQGDPENPIETNFVVNFIKPQKTKDGDN